MDEMHTYRCNLEVNKTKEKDHAEVIEKGTQTKTKANIQNESTKHTQM